MSKHLVNITDLFKKSLTMNIFDIVMFFFAVSVHLRYSHDVGIVSQSSVHPFKLFVNNQQIDVLEKKQYDKLRSFYAIISFETKETSLGNKYLSYNINWSKTANLY